MSATVTLIVWLDSAGDDDQYWTGTGWSFDRAAAREYTLRSMAESKASRLKSERPASRYTLRTEEVLP